MFNFKLACAIMAIPMCFPHVLFGQEVVHDSLVGTYTITYYDSRGSERSLTVNAMNNLRPKLSVAITKGEVQLDYQYLLANQAITRETQPIGIVDILCPPDAPDLRITSKLGRGYLTEHPDERIHVCRFRLTGHYVHPGHTLDGLRIETTYLPGISEASVFGIPRIQEGLGQHEEELPPNVLSTFRSITGFGFFTGGGLRILTVAPLRTISEMEDATASLVIVDADVSSACDLSWISNPGVCNSFRTKLEQAGRALERGRNEAAIGQLQAFLNELEAQHGDEPGKHVNDNAYWLLKVNVEFILERMNAGEA